MIIKLGLCVAWLLTSDVSNAHISVRIWKTKTLCCLKPSESNNPATECRIEDTGAQIRDFQTTFLGPNWQAVSVCVSGNPFLLPRQWMIKDLYSIYIYISPKLHYWTSDTVVHSHGLIISLGWTVTLAPPHNWKSNIGSDSFPVTNTFCQFWHSERFS
jgi:hypothetical protein